MNYNKKLKDMTYEELVEVAKYMIEHHDMSWSYYFFEGEWKVEDALEWDDDALVLTMPYVCLYAWGNYNYFIDFDRCESGSMDFTVAEWEAKLK